MATLKFFAREDFLCNLLPGTVPAYKSVPRYINRGHEPRDGHAAYPALPDPFVCDSESDIGRNLLRKMGAVPNSPSRRKNPPLWPADEATAQRCGVPFVATEFKDGVHRPKVSTTPPDKPKASSKGATSEV